MIRKPMTANEIFRFLAENHLWLGFSREKLTKRMWTAKLDASTGIMQWTGHGPTPTAAAASAVRNFKIWQRGSA